MKTNSNPISVLGKYCLKVFNIIESLSISEEKTNNFLSTVEKNYLQNPYHNAIHASDILISALYLINSSFLSANLSDIEILVIIISHLCHDICHPGFNNRFLITFQDKLALDCN